MTFGLLSARALVGSRIRVYFSEAPGEVVPSDFVLAGASEAPEIIEVADTYDVRALDLVLGSALPAGRWSVSVGTIFSEALQEISWPVSAFFAFQTEVLPDSGGDLNEDEELEALRTNIPPAYRGMPGWTAVLGAIATGDAHVNDVAIKAWDQAWPSTASGKYLDQRGEDRGHPRPAGVGLPDSLYRQLLAVAPVKQLGRWPILQILEIFYGSEALRAFADTSDGPWALEDGQTLDLEVDGQELTVTFRTADFAQISQVTAVELAAVLSRALGEGPWAQTNGLGVRIYSGRLATGRVQVTGGTAWPALGFPQQIAAVSDTVTWSQIGDGLWSLTWTSATPLTIEEGDIMVVGAPNVVAANRGAFEVVSVVVAWTGSEFIHVVSILQPNGFPQAVAPSSPIYAMRPTAAVPALGADAIQEGDQFVITMPATSRVVVRDEDSGWFLPGASLLDITSIERLTSGETLITAPGHGQLADFILSLEDYLLTPTLPATVPADVADDEMEASQMTIWSEMDETLVGDRYGARALASPLEPSRVYLIGGRGGSESSRLQAIDVGSTLLTSGPARGRRVFDYTFTERAAMPSPRFSHGASVLRGSLAGQILVTGGQTGGGSPDIVGSPIVYSPTANAWSDAETVGTMGTRKNHVQILVEGPTGDDLVVVVGGLDDGSDVVSQVQSWVPDAGGTVADVVVDVPRWFAAGCALEGPGEWMVCGGFSDVGPGDVPPIPDEVIQLRDAADEVIPLASTSVADLGFQDGLDPIDDCIARNEVTGTAIATGSMIRARAGHVAVHLGGGQVLVVGGADTDLSPVMECEVWSRATGQWRLIGPSPRGRIGAEHAIISDSVWVWGGVGADGLTVEGLDVFDVALQSWSHYPLSWSTDAPERGLEAASAAIEVDGEPLVLRFGGRDLDGVFSARATDQVHALIPGALGLSPLSVNQSLAATVIDANTLSVQQPEGAYGLMSGGTGISQAPEASDVVSSFIQETRGGLRIQAVFTTLTTALEGGTQATILDVDNVTTWPSSGQLVLGLGQEFQAQTSFSRIDNTRLRVALTPGQDIPAGATVFLALVGADTEGGYTWATGSALGRIRAQEILDEKIVMAGVPVLFRIVYPGSLGLADGDESWVWGE